LRFVGRLFGRWWRLFGRRFLFCMRLHQIKQGDGLRRWRGGRPSHRLSRRLSGSRLRRFTVLALLFFIWFVLFDFFFCHNPLATRP
jgi:hypothetical protein